MAWVFNPFTGKLDFTNTGGGGGGTPGGSSGQVQYNNGGAFGGMSGTTWTDASQSLAIASTGTGTGVTTSSPVLNLSQTWNAGAVTFTGLKFNVTNTASANASKLFDFQVGGTSRFEAQVGNTVVRATGYYYDTTVGYYISDGVNGSWGAGNFRLINSAQIGWVNSSNANSGTADLFLTRAAAATLQLGAADAAAPVAQTFKVQGVVAGTTNTAGANFTIQGSQGTGTGAGGSIIFQVAPAGSSGTAQNAYSTALTLGNVSGNGWGSYAYTPNGTNWLFVGGDGNNYPGVYASTGAFVVRTAQYTNMFSVNTVGIHINAAAGVLSFGGGYSINTSGDVVLARDAANTLALRNGGTAASPVPQTFNVYNFYAGASDYERAALYFTSNSAWVEAQAAGTGTLRSLNVNGLALNLRSGGTLRWQIDTSGHFIAGADNTYDIGASGASRPRNVYVAGNVVAGGSLGLQLGNGAAPIYWAGRSQISSPANGNIQLVNASQNDFDRLQFGGTTSSFPALKRSSATLQVRLADDSAFTDISSRGVIYNGVTFANLPGTPTTGTVAYVTDASNAGAAWGDSVTAGGSTNKYLVWYNGTNWTVVGK